MSDKTCGVDAHIVSKPVSVNYTCPSCEEVVSEPYDSFCDDIWHGDYMTCCPHCGEDVILEDVDYD